MNGSVARGYVGKDMTITEVEVTGQLVGRGRTALAGRGGIPLPPTQLRALVLRVCAEGAGRCQGAGTREERLLQRAHTGRRRPYTECHQGCRSRLGGVSGARFDANIMSRMLDFAEVFHLKRFVLEKDLRVCRLAEGATSLGSSMKSPP